MQHNADMQRTEFGLGPVYPAGSSAPLLGVRDSDATLPTRGSFVGLQQRVPSAASFTGMMPGHMMQYGPMGMQGMMPMQYMAHPSQMSQGMMAPPPVQGQRSQPQVFFHVSAVFPLTQQQGVCVWGWGWGQKHFSYSAKDNRLDDGETNLVAHMTPSSVNILEKKILI